MNALGQIFKVTSFGESHGEAVGCVIEGCPAGLHIDLDRIKRQLKRRSTAQSEFSSSRKEEDQIEWISGVYEGRTLGSPITILIRNTNAQSSDYDHLKNVFRPGHADFTNEMKYGFRDHRGGGRSSIRITAPMVVAGELALQLIQTYYPVEVIAFVSGIGKAQLEHDSDTDLSIIDENPFRCPSPGLWKRFEHEVKDALQHGDTLGGRITCRIRHLPIGIGEPLFGKLHAVLAHAMFSINTVRGVEFGDGFTLSEKRGSEVKDEFISGVQGIQTETNHNSGIQGGISNGMPIEYHVAFKPISSIQQIQNTVDKEGNPTELLIRGRHDVCAVPRAVPIVEAYTQIVLADLILLSRFNQCS